MTTGNIRLWGNVALGVAGVFLWGRTAAAVMEGKGNHDLRIYLEAGRVYALGGNPYADHGDRPGFDSPGGARFMYPPYVLPLFSAASSFDQKVVTTVLTGVKLLALVCLLLVWSIVFMPDKQWIGLLLLLSAAAFNSAGRLDLLSGNVATYENLLLWMSFLAFVRGKHIASAILVFAASSLKLTLILFAIPLFVLGRRHMVRPLAALFAISAAAIGFSLLNEPSLWTAFMNNILSADERGHVNPASLALLRDVVDTLGLGNAAVSSTAGSATYIVHTFAVLTVFIRFLRNAGGPTSSTPVILSLSVITYLLCMPRMKDYSYIILVMPAFMMLLNRTVSRTVRFILFVVVCFPFFSYQPFFAAWILFFLQVGWRLDFPRQAAHHSG